MNLSEIIKTLNEFRGRRFLIVLGSGFLAYFGKLDPYYAVCIALAYFVCDVVEKYIVHKTEEETK